MARQGSVEGRTLWRRLAAEPHDEAPTPAPDPTTLAAWLEGRVADVGAGQVESWLDDDPETLDEIRALRASIADPPLDPPPEWIAAARALVIAPPRKAWEPRSLAWLQAPAFATSLAAVAAVSGFLMGAATFGEIEATEARIAAALWTDGGEFDENG